MKTWVCRRTHKPGGDIRAVLGEEGVADPSSVVHGSTVLGSNLRCWVGEGVPEVTLH